MTNYEKLDWLITMTITGNSKFLGDILSDNLVFLEAERIAMETGRDLYRIVDGRLQALRKRGVIRYAKGRGWVVVGDKK